MRWLICVLFDHAHVVDRVWHRTDGGMRFRLSCRRCPEKKNVQFVSWETPVQLVDKVFGGTKVNAA